MKEKDENEEFCKNFSDSEWSEFEKRRNSAFEKWEKNKEVQKKSNTYNFISVFILAGCFIGATIAVLLDASVSYGVLYGVLLGFCLGSFLGARRKK